MDKGYDLTRVYDACAERGVKSRRYAAYRSEEVARPLRLLAVSIAQASRSMMRRLARSSSSSAVRTVSSITVRFRSLVVTMM